MMFRLSSPTGKSIRATDGWGSGEFAASRGGRPHYGADFVCIPGQIVYAPCDALVVREARPYPDEPFSGVLLMAAAVEIKMFYLQPSVKPGTRVVEGQEIGRAQDISQKYPGITPHVHLEVYARPGIAVLRTGDAVYLDPELFLTT